MPAGTHTDAPKSPFNSGLFVTEPSTADYKELLQIVKDGDYDLNHSWAGAFNDIEGKYRPRKYAPFYGAETTQGLLYYYFHTVKRSFKLLPRDVYHYQGVEDDPQGVMLVHFNICDKPLPGVLPERCRGLHSKWQAVYQKLNFNECL